MLYSISKQHMAIPIRDVFFTYYQFESTCYFYVMEFILFI